MAPFGVILLLFIAAAALLMVEVLLPAHGLIGAMGVVLALVGVGVVFYHNQWAGVGVAYGLAAATPFAVVLWLKIWPRTPLGKRLILAAPTSRRPLDDAQSEAAGTTSLIGQVGITTSELRPGGTCEVAGQRVACSAEHGLIPRDTAIRIIAVTDGHLVVRPA
jgi:membrane-bound ClpP family serine protease